MRGLALGLALGPCTTFAWSHCALAKPKFVVDTTAMAAVEERGQLVCVEPCVEPCAPWACANPDCGATTASKRRGPNLEFCSKAKCKALASQAAQVS